MTYKIGVFGSAEGDLEKILDKAHKLGEILGRQKVIVVSGASGGLPYEVGITAKKHGAKIWGYSPGTDYKTQQERLPNIDSSIFDKLFYVPQNYTFASDKKACLKYRNVTSTASCDAGIIISGRWGTMNEFTNLFDMDKVISVLSGTGGIADELPNLLLKISKKSNAVVLFDASPEKLVEKMLNVLGKRKKTV